MNVATQSRRKNFGKCPPVRVKDFISCSYRDLDFFATHLESITTETYTAELVKKTEDRGDCCMLSIVEWGHARLEYEEDIGLIGEFAFRVNETCLSSDHDIFMVAPTDRDVHNPILVHLHPADMVSHERRAYIPYEMKQRRKEKKKATQKSTTREGVMAMVLQWTCLVATGIILAMVDPQLHPRGQTKEQVSVYFCR